MARVRLPLAAKIGTFAVLLVALACAAVWLLAVWRPMRRERMAREAQYAELGRVLGASGAVTAQTDLLKKPGIHPDLAYVLRSKGGALGLPDCVAHAARLAPLDPDLADLSARDPEAAFGRLRALSSGERPHLVVKRVTVRSEGADEEIVLGFSTLALDQEFADRLRRSLEVLVLSLVAALAGAVLLARAIAGPVRALAAAMDRLGQGAYEVVHVRSRDEVGLLARAFNDMVHGLKERERLKGTLARYVSDDVASRILTERSDLDLAGELKEVTVLFLDIRGFTALSERLPAREIVEMLNEYFELIIEVVFKHHGTVNKFIGDAVMAIFGAPRAIDDPAMCAVRTAVEIEQRIATHNHARREQGRAVFTVGIGINTGVVIAGNIGSARRMEYTVIGDDVNLAQRLEAVARESEVLISQATFEKVEGRVEARAREPISVKGKAIPVRVYEVVGVTG